MFPKPQYGQQTKQPQQPAPMSYMAASPAYYNYMGQDSQARYGYMGQADAAKFGAQAQTDTARYGAQAQADSARYASQGQQAQAQYGGQANKDMAAFGALRDLGIAGQTNMANYGGSLNNALVNSQIAQANALGQLGANYYNTLGQGMQAQAAMNAAASQAGAETNKASALGGLAGGMLNAQMYGAQMAPYTSGNMSFPSMSFGGGFHSSGPEGVIASGSYGGGPRIQGGPDRQFNPPPAPPYVQGGGGGRGVNPYEPFHASTRSLQGMMQGLSDPYSLPNQARGDITGGFRATQNNLMNPGIRNSMNAQMAMGYDVLGKLYDKSDYGFNTKARPFSTQFNPGGNRFYY